MNFSSKRMSTKREDFSLETIPIHMNFAQFTNTIDLVSEDLQFTGNNSRTFLLDSIYGMTNSRAFIEIIAIQSYAVFFAL